MTIFEAVAQIITGKFIPAVDTSKKYDKENRPTTLYNALMTHLGFGTQDSVLSAVNHHEMSETIRWFYATLDDVLGQRSQPWSMRPERTEGEVVDLLKKASGTAGSTTHDYVVAEIRPGNTKLAGRGKHRAAIGIEATLIASTTDSSFASVIREVFSSAPSDRDALSTLEQRRLEEVPETIDWTPAKAWASGYSTYSSQEDARPNLAAYCEWLFTSWEDVTNEDLINRVKELTPVTDRKLTPATA